MLLASAQMQEAEDPWRRKVGQREWQANCKSPSCAKRERAKLHQEMCNRSFEGSKGRGIKVLGFDV